MENECIFCKIGKGEIPSSKVYEDNDMLAFLDIHPVNKGHLLIIPKEHFPFMPDVPDELLSKLFVKAKELMVILKKAVEADFVVCSVVGLDVLHFHIHLVPRYHKDGLKDFWPTKEYKENEIEQFKEKIAKFI